MHNMLRNKIGLKNTVTFVIFTLILIAIYFFTVTQKFQKQQYHIQMFDMLQEVITKPDTSQLKVSNYPKSFSHFLHIFFTFSSHTNKKHNFSLYNLEDLSINPTDPYAILIALIVIAHHVQQEQKIPEWAKFIISMSRNKDILGSISSFVRMIYLDEDQYYSSRETHHPILTYISSSYRNEYKEIILPNGTQCYK